MKIIYYKLYGIRNKQQKKELFVLKNNAPYKISIKALVQELTSDLEKGLSTEEALHRLKLYGPNELSNELHYDSLLIIFFKQFNNALIYILLIAALLVFISGQHLDAFVVGIILFFNALLGTVQEGKAQNILKSLQQYSTSECVVLRDGKHIIIPSKDVVVGDIIILQEGEKVPADARLIQSYNLHLDESMLTGESSTITKTSDIIPQESEVADQNNMVFKATYNISGSGIALVTAIGNATQIGQLKKITEQAGMRDFPLKKKLDALSITILKITTALCILLFLIGFFMGKSLHELLAILAALFVCIVPEGLPLVFTLTLVQGARRMAHRNLLVKKLHAVEGLGTTDVIIIDKTGTLTRNEMVVTKLFTNNHYLTVTGQGYFKEGKVLYNNSPYKDQNLIFLAQFCTLLNQTTIAFNKRLKLFTVKGEPLEAAMGIFAHKVIGDVNLEHEFIKFYQLPFDYKTRTKAHFYYHNDMVITIVSGAPENILSSCKNDISQAYQALKQFLSEGLRLVAIGYKECTQKEFEEKQQKNKDFYEQWITDNVTFLALMGIQDAIRPEVASVIANTRKAGLKIVMATGDHKDTALAVAQKVDIFNRNDEYMEGSELAQLSDEEVLSHLNKITVFARVTPEQKLRIVTLYQKMGNIVTMTGDGVNDAPALVAADLGTAMGNIGTDVAKQAADIILLDDSFLTIVEAIKEGRHIFLTLRRVTYYFFTTNAGELLLIFFALIFNMPIPLFPAQILWLNLVTDGFLDVSLTVEPKEKNLLSTSIKSHNLLDKNLLFKIVYISVPMALISLTLFYYYQSNLALARTMTLTTMALFQWFNIWNCRSERKSIFSIGFFTNKWLVIACCFVFFLQLLVLYVPFMQTLFRTVPLTFNQWLLITALSSSIIIIEEVRKWFSRRFFSEL
jgi:P-type Ca2+ transporter type 2C